MSSIKAILIDVEAKELREIILDRTEGNELDAIYKAVKCDCICSVESWIFQPLGHVLFVDDEGLLLNNPIGAFQIADGQVLSGNGIIVGSDIEGNTVDHYLRINVLRAFVHFKDVQELPEPAFTITSM